MTSQMVRSGPDGATAPSGDISDGSADCSADKETKRVTRQGLRSDAARNRARIVAAAQTVFADRGVNAPLEDVARSAGVGIATVYRRFPTRPDLVAAAFEEKMRSYAEAIESALAAPDPWEGFAGYVFSVCEMQAQDAGFADALSLTFPAAEVFEQQRRRAQEKFAELVRRAQADGTLRADFVPADMMVVLVANAGLVMATRDGAPDAWRRFAAYQLDAFRSPGRSELPDPPTEAGLRRAMRMSPTEI
jgi:AcrR family transcriptional regulator